MRAVIALGSNLGDRLANLSAARAKIEQLTKVEPPILASSVFETEPVDCEAGAGKFLNAVVEVGYSGAGKQLLGELRKIEAALGRPAAHLRNASRTIDLDLLYAGDVMSDAPELQLPHPRMTERRFVLEPLAEIQPGLILPGQSETVATLLLRLPADAALLRVASEW